MSFLTNIRRFSKRITRICLQTNNIFGISTKNCVDLCVFQIVSATFFRSNFHPWFPWGLCRKTNSIKTTILLVSSVSFCLEIAFYGFKTSFRLLLWLFDWIHFSTYPRGGPGEKIWPKKKVAETISNTHRSTQFFVLIPNIIFLWSQIGIILLENHQILVKNDRNWVPRVVLEQKWFTRHRILSWKQFY